MLKNYLKIAIRNLLRNKTFSAINILGLAVGIASCVLILLYVQNEFSFDSFNKNYKRIFRVGQNQVWYGNKSASTITSARLGPALKDNFPEIQNYVRVYNVSRFLIKYKDKTYFEDNLKFVDSSFFNVFSFHLLEGNPSLVFSKPYSIVLTKSEARKYFGNEEAVGKTIILIRNNKAMNFTVTGVASKPPSNSSLRFGFLASFNTLYESTWNFQDINDWGQMSFLTFVLLTKDQSFNSLQARLPGFVNSQMKQDMENFKVSLFLQPIRDIHLFSHFEFDPLPNADVKSLYIFSVIAVFLLLIACINFMNLSTARYTKRAKEIGVRKVMGAARLQLIKQFLGESIIISFAATCLAIMLVEIILPITKNFINVDLKFNLLNSISIPAALLAVAIITGLTAGLYPAVLLASFNPASIFKSNFKSSNIGTGARKGLVLFQFVITIALIVCAVIIRKQLDYVQHANLGFNKNNVVVIPLNTQEAANNAEVYQTEIRRNPGVILTTDASDYPGSSNFSRSTFETTGANTRTIWMNSLYVDSTYIKTLGIKIIKEKGYTASASGNEILINETAEKEIGFAEPIGKELTGGNGDKLTIVGVFKDFNFQSLREKIAPQVLRLGTPSYGNILCRVKPENYSSTISFLNKKWKEINPETPFEYSFLDQDWNKLYVHEMKFGIIANIFSCLAIAIACLGLFGLVTFSVEERTKEIGIRKVLGASVGGVVKLLSKDFVKVVLLANLIAWPTAYYFMTKWLNSFAYKTGISIWIFLMAGAIALFVALATVSFQAIKAATANPVKSLRYE